MKNIVNPVLIIGEVKNNKEKSKTSMNVNYFNSTNDRILLNKHSDKFKSSFENSFSKSLHQPKNNNHSISQKNCSIFHESNEKENERKKRNNKAIQIHKTEIEISICKDSIVCSKPPTQIKIKNFKKYNLDPKTIKRIFTKTPPSLTELSILKNNNNIIEKPMRLEDMITLSILKRDSKSRIKKVFSVVNFEVLIIKVYINS